MQEPDDLRLLIDAAQAAGEIAMRYFRADVDVWDKDGGQGPVTQADLDVNAMLEDRLRSARPDYGWLSEESADDPSRLSAEHTFIIDPIDGTRAFVDGTSAFSHALAVARGGVVTAGVVFLPAQNRLYAAAAGGGATLNGTPIRAAQVERMRDAVVLASRPSLAPEDWPGGVPDVKRTYRPSIAYRICLVGQGRFDAMVTLRDAWEWDIAAGTLIAREAGAVVTDASGAECGFNSADRRHGGCIVAGPKLHAALMALRKGPEPLT